MVKRQTRRDDHSDIYKTYSEIEKINMLLFGHNGKNGIFDDINAIRKEIRYIYMMLIIVIIILAGIFGERFVELIK